jgi:hypothetical protein
MRLNTYEDVVRGSMHFDLIVFRSDMLKMSEDDLDVRHRLYRKQLVLQKDEVEQIHMERNS